MAFDFKKEYKEFYMPKNKPQIVNVPKANYIAVRGKGNPNEEGGAYQQAISVLYLARFIRLVKRYVDVEELTPEIINAFIDRIEIGKKEKVFDRKMQDITIVYNFVGAIDLPQYENY